MEAGRKFRGLFDQMAQRAAEYYLDFHLNDKYYGVIYIDTTGCGNAKGHSDTILNLARRGAANLIIGVSGTISENAPGCDHTAIVDFREGKISGAITVKRIAAQRTNNFKI